VIPAIEMTRNDYLACHEQYRRVGRGQQEELLVLDRVTGEHTWVPVKIVDNTRKAPRHASQTAHHA